MPIAENISRKRGDTYPIEITILEDIKKAYDMTGATNIRLGAASERDAEGGASIEWDIAGTISGDATDGLVEFPVTPANADINAGTYYCEVTFEQNSFIITTDTFELRMEGQILT